MKKIFIVISLVISHVIFIVMLAACDGATGGKSSTKTETIAAITVKEPVETTYIASLTTIVTTVEATTAVITTVATTASPPETTVSPEEIKQNYISKCISVSYDKIARDREGMKGEDLTFTGEIIQVLEGSDGSCTYRMNVTYNNYRYSDTIGVLYYPKIDEGRILEGDIVTIYGSSLGLWTYTSTLGQKITIPSIIAVYIDRK